MRKKLIALFILLFLVLMFTLLAPPAVSKQTQGPMCHYYKVPVETMTPSPSPLPVYKPSLPQLPVVCGDNVFANYIYFHESGCRTQAVSPTGCFGIGQDCNGVLQNSCGNDYACQNKFFTSYALRRYGSWEKAYNFWSIHRYW